jgi:hypothetical protein
MSINTYMARSTEPGNGYNGGMRNDLVDIEFSEGVGGHLVFEVDHEVKQMFTRNTIN